MKRISNSLRLIPICLVLALIWGNSLLSGEVSGAISGGLLGYLIDTFPVLSWLPEFVLRKIGHFSEFCLLGLLLAGYFAAQGQKGIHQFSMPLLFSMLAANMDETIQVFVPNRGPSVVDVWIDVSGACVGIAVFYAIRAVVRMVKMRKE